MLNVEPTGWSMNSTTFDATFGLTEPNGSVHGNHRRVINHSKITSNLGLGVIGPYKELKWFLPDFSIVLAIDPLTPSELHCQQALWESNIDHVSIFYSL